jgi:hypothetical protein
MDRLETPGASSPKSNYSHYIDLPSEFRDEATLVRGADLSHWSPDPVLSPEAASNTPASPIDKFPVELRLEMLETLCIFDQNMPALIITPQPLRTLYHEALQLFYKNSSFVLQQGNNFCLGDFGDRKGAVLTIQKFTFLNPYVISPSTSNLG